MASNNIDLLSYAKKARAWGWSSIPVKTDKQPNVPQVIPFRDTLLTDSELDKLFGANKKQTTTHVAVIVDNDKFAIDMDGEGENVFIERILSRLNQELIHKVNRTTNTKSPHGRHLLGRTKGGNKQLTKKEHIWQSPSKNDEIRLRLYGFYSIEYGQGYEEIIGIENSQVFEPEEISEIIRVASEVTKEFNAIRSITNLVRPYYVTGNRDEINFALSGYLHKRLVPEQLIFDIVAPIINYSNPVEPKKTRDVIHTTCQKDRNSSEVSGYKRLLTAFNGDLEKVQEIERILFNGQAATEETDVDIDIDIGTGNEDRIQYCIDTILKEAKLEDRLVKQIFYTMLSAYTSNPVNLAINSPSGEGKNYVLRKVVEHFPKDDAMVLAGMTDKALFHRAGKLVIKNGNGVYEDVKPIIKELDERIEDLEKQESKANDKTTKDGFKKEIKVIENEIKEIYAEAKKLIELNHKILIFLDTPSFGLFNAIMPLLSHDSFEVEYEYADTTNNGIKTRTNIIRGYPAVIFAQAIDFSDNRRYTEIQRRFIITNPKMEKQKYKEAIKLMGQKFGLPDFLYQTKVVSDQEKENVAKIIKWLKKQILQISNTTDPGKNNVVIPFQDIITNSLRSDKAQDMTLAYRLFSYLSLLPTINISKRPTIWLNHSDCNDGNGSSQVIPLATYDDLAEAIFLMQYATGVREYVLEWYRNVFLKTYNAKTEPDSKTFNKGKEERVEDRIGVTKSQLADATKKEQQKTFTTQKILESYLYPLMNEGYVDRQESRINAKSFIYYPAVEGDPSSSEEGKSLFDWVLDQRTNDEQQISRIKAGDFTLKSIREYIKAKVEEVVCCSFPDDLNLEIFGHEHNSIAAGDLVSTYYRDPTGVFSLKEEFSNNNSNDNNNNNNKPSNRPSQNEHQTKPKSGSVDQTEVNDFRSTEKIEENEQRITPNVYQVHADAVDISTAAISNRLYDYTINRKVILQHYRSLVCNYCNSETANENYYNRHTVTRHRGEQGYPDRNGRTSLGF
jgi:hypothetical protein